MKGESLAVRLIFRHAAFFCGASLTLENGKCHPPPFPDHANRCVIVAWSLRPAPPLGTHPKRLSCTVRNVSVPPRHPAWHGSLPGHSRGAPPQEEHSSTFASRR